MNPTDTLKQAAQALRINYKKLALNQFKPSELPDFLRLADALEAMAGQPKQYLTAVKWPDGYCLDPNGVMCCPAGMHEAWSFGYDLGYADALAVRAAPIATPEHDDDGGWTKHTEYHWSRMVNGNRLDYWPSRKKFQYLGKVQRGDVMKIVRSVTGADHDN